MAATHERTIRPTLSAAAESRDACIDTGHIVKAVDGNRDVFAGTIVTETTVISEVDAIRGGDTFSSGEILAKAVIVIELPVNSTSTGTRKTANPCARKGESIGEILQSR